MTSETCDQCQQQWKWYYIKSFQGRNLCSMCRSQSSEGATE